MLTPPRLERLLAQYAAIAAHPPIHPSADLQRSLTYFRHDIRDQAVDVLFGQPAVRTVAWFKNLNRLELFVAGEGRFPRENNRPSGRQISVEERQLAVWVRTERTAANLGRRCDFQLQRLACVPGYRETPLDDRWMARFLAYERSLASLGHPPVLSGNNPGDRALAGWAAKQRMAHRSGTLGVRRQRLLQTLSIWTWGSGRP
ncbi:hypothetical protein ABIB56_001514 [Glaciihabitans sp. UYNi722]